MGEDGKVIYKVVIDDDGVESAAENAGRKAGDGVDRGARPGTGAFKEAMIGAARAIGEAFVEMAAKAVHGVEQIAKAGIEFNAQMEQYQTAFTTLIGDADQAAAALEQIRKDAASTPFDVASLVQANQALLATGMDADAARTDVMNLANAIAATGGGSAELSRMAANMQQIRNTGKATAMDIRQFANAGINIYGLLADSMGVTVEQAAEMDVTYEQLTAAFAKAAEAGGAFEGAMEAQSQTFNGRISTLKDNATQLAGALTEDLFNQLSGNGLPMVMDWVATLLEAAQTGGIEGAIEAARGILSNLLQTFLDNLPEMLDMGLTVLESFLDGIASGSGDVGSVILQILQMLVTAIINHGPQLLTSGINLVLQLAAGLIRALPQLLSMAGQLIVGLLRAFANADWVSIGSNIVSGIWAGIAGLWDWLVGQVTGALDSLWSWAKSILGIASPSKKFKYIGEMSVEGMEEGFEGGEQDLTRTVTNVMAGTLDTAAGVTGGDLERNVSYNLAATTGGTTIIVPLTLDGREIARATAWSMGEQLAWEEM